MSAATTITVRVPLTIRRRPGRRTVVTPDGMARVAATYMRADPAMVKALARAFRWKRMLEEGRYTSISEIAAVEKIDRGYVGSILRLTLLAPDIVEAIIDGRQPEALRLPALLEPFSVGWDQQRTNWLVAIEELGDDEEPTIIRQETINSPATLKTGEQHRRIRHARRRPNVTKTGNADP